MADESPDFSIIGEIQAKSSASSVQSAELLGLEQTALAQGKIDFESERFKHDIEKNRVELDKLRADLTNALQDISLRKSFSGQILKYLWIFSAFCGAALLLQGFHIKGFSLETPVLVTLVGGTAASAFGLVSVVLGGLFRQVATSVAKDIPKPADRTEQRPPA